MAYYDMLKESLLWFKVVLPTLPDKGVKDTNRVTGEALEIRPLQEVIRLHIRELEALLGEQVNLLPSPQSTVAATGPYEPPLVYDPQQVEMVAPGANLISQLRGLFDKTAEAHDGDYPAKVGAALVAVYAYGRRRQESKPPSSIERVTEDGPLGGFATIGTAAAELDLALTNFQTEVEAMADAEANGLEEAVYHGEQVLKLKREIIERYTPRTPRSAKTASE